MIEALDARTLLTALTAVATLGSVTIGGGAMHTINVTYRGGTGIDSSTVNSQDLLVTGPNDFNQLALCISRKAEADGSVTGSYRVIAPGSGGWDTAENGSYTVALQSNQVKDKSGTAVGAKTLGSFRVNVGSFTSGSYNDIAYDASGRLYVAYYDAVQKDLMFTYRGTTGSWSTPTVIDHSSADVGQFVSLALDSHGVPSVAYYDATNTNLKYAQYNAGTWTTTVVDSGGSAGAYPSVGFDASNNPAISYYYQTAGDLRFALRTSGVWHRSTIDSSDDTGKFTSIALNPVTHRWAIAYQNSTRGQYRIAQQTSGSWQRTVVDATPLGGVTISLAFDKSGHPAFSYYDAKNADLKFARFDGSKWSKAAVATVGAQGAYNSLSFLSDGRAEILYYNRTANALYSALGNIGSWTFTRIASGGGRAVSGAYSPTGVRADGLMVDAGGMLLVQTANNRLPDPPTAPSGLAGTALSATRVMVSWTDNSSNEAGFWLERSPNGTDSWQLCATTGPNIESAIDGRLIASTTYYYRVRAMGAETASAFTPVMHVQTAASDAPQYLLTPTVLAAMKAKAAANTAQWRAFKAQLDAKLNQVTEGDYQGWELPAIADYSLGYQVLKDSDPITAAAYADKAIAVLLMGVHDDIRDETASRLLLARGDGAARQFTLPNTGINASTFKVWLPTVNVKTVTKGPANGQDLVDYNHTFLKVSNSSDGSADYVQGTDWRYNPEYGDSQIDWSLSHNQPATGATYYVTEVSSNGLSNQTTGFSLSGNTLTFATAPAADKAIIIEYQYSTPSLTHQQTGDGRGGFNNVQIDSGYTSRNLKYVAIGLDWLWSYAGLTEQIRSDARSLLVRWSDYLRDNGLGINTPSSNYGVGHYAYRVAVAAALQNRDPNAARLLAEVQAYHANYIMPLLAAPANGQGTEQGGFWAEGWNYGTGSVINLLTSAAAFESAGVGSAAAEHAWANDVIKALLHEQPTQSTVFDGGRGYAWPQPSPSSTLWGILASAATDPTLKSYATYSITHGAGASGSVWQDFMFQDPGIAPAFWGSSLPLQYLSAGQGIAFARKDWSYNSTWLAFHSGNLAPNLGLVAFAQGALEINRGPDALLVNAPAAGSDDSIQTATRAGNTVVIDDGGAGEQTYRYAQGIWYGNPGVSMPHFEGTAAYTYMQGNYAAAYTHNSGEPGSPNPATELARDVFYVRGSDYVIVYDRAATTQASYLKQLRWHFVGTTSVSGDSWTVTQGSSKLFGQTLSDVPLTTASQPVQVGGTTVQEVTTNNTTAATAVRYVTAMQVASSTTAAMDASSRIASADGKVEGVRIGSYVVLFGRNGAVSGSTSYDMTAGSGAVVTHYVSDLKPGFSYSLAGANQATATASPQGVLTFTTTGTGSPQTVVITNTTANSPPTVRDQTINVAANSPKLIHLDATDPDGDPLTFNVVTSGGPGTVGTISSDGDVTFTPDAGATGTAWFNYTVTDGNSPPVSGAVTVPIYTPNSVVINIADGQTDYLTQNLTNFTSLTIQGAGENSVLDGNGFQIFNDNLPGQVTISNVRLRNVGQNWIDGSGNYVDSTNNYAIYLKAMGDASVSIDDTVFDASSSVYLYNDPDSTAEVRGNTVLSNSLAPGGVTPQVSAPFFTGAGWQSKYTKVFEQNRVYESYVSFPTAKNWIITDNVIIGDRGGIDVERSDSIEIARNYIHCLHDYAATDPGNPYGSQVSNLLFDQDTNISTHDNVLRDGEWMVRGLDGDFYNNVLLDLQSHNWIINPHSGARIHENIFAPRYDGQIVILDSGIYLYDATTSDVEIYNNTFDGGPGFTGPAIAIGPGVTLGSVRSNLFYNFPTNWYSGNAIVRPAWNESLSGDPPRPASDPDRMAYANFNAFYNPNATAGTANYAVGVNGASYGTAAFGSGDINGAAPQLKAPPSSFPFTDADIKSGVVTVAQILTVYRDGYSLLPGSLLLAAAAPQDAAEGRANIGAV